MLRRTRARPPRLCAGSCSAGTRRGCAGLSRRHGRRPALGDGHRRRGPPRARPHQRDDFHVFEDSVLQEISHFSDQPEPISLSLLLDTSNSMETQNKLALAQQAGVGLHRAAGPEGRRADRRLRQPDEDPGARSPATRTCSTRALRQTKAGGSTSLYNAIYTALSDLKRLRRAVGRRDRGGRPSCCSRTAKTRRASCRTTMCSIRRSDREVIVYADRRWSTKDQAAVARLERGGIRAAIAHARHGRPRVLRRRPAQLPAIYVQISESWPTSTRSATCPRTRRRTARGAAIDAAGAQRRRDAAHPRPGYFAPTEKK